MQLEGASAKVVYNILAEVENLSASEPPKEVCEMPSSPVSTFTATSSGIHQEDHSKLSEEEEKIAERYRMMLKHGVPPDAVRHKLAQDRVETRIATAVLHMEETKPDEPKSLLTSDEEAVAQKYRKMLSLGIPPDAVHHSMVKDQVSEKIVTAVLGNSREGTSKMTAPPAIQPAPDRKDKQTLTQDEESIASHYRKLLKSQVPRTAVQSRMEREGVSEKIMKAVLGSIDVRDAESKASCGGGSTGSNLINLHWNAMEAVPAGSVWETNKNTAEPESIDINKLVELFQKKQPTNANQKSSRGETVGVGKAKLLDLARSNNIAISLKAFKEFKHEELADVIRFLDPTRRIRGE